MQIVLLTGASGGIGMVFTRRLLKAGYKVVAVAGRHEGKLKNIKHPNIRVFSADLSSYSGIKSLHDKVVEEVGHPHILIHNAGVNANAMSWKLSNDDWHNVLAVNLNAAFHISSLCIPNMRELRWGRIVYISSIVASQGVPGTSAYAASKAGLQGLMRAQSVELASRGVTVNAIAPGYLQTGMIQDVPEKMQEAIRQRIPVGSLGNPEELAEMLLWITGENSGYVTGQTLHFNGGLQS